MVICGVVFAASTTTFGSEMAGHVTASLGAGAVSLARLGKSHHSKSSHSSSSHSSAKVGKGEGKKSSSSSSSSSSVADGVTGKCQNIPADNAAGTFQFQDKRCGKGSASVPGCVGESHCRFCQTSIVPSSARNKGWPMCPIEVCKEMKALGCRGEDASSKKEVLWQLARDKALKHNEYVKGVSVGRCSTTPADRKLGRHQFSDASCKTNLGAGCLGGASLCRFCQLSKGKGKQETNWVTCPDVVCKKWKVKGGGCEPPLALVSVPPKHPTDDFDVKKEEKAQAKVLTDFLKKRDAPVKSGGGGGGGGSGGPGSHGDGLLRKNTKPTGDIVVDLLQSKDRGLHGVTLKTSGGGGGGGKGSKSSSSSKHKSFSSRGRRLME